VRVNDVHAALVFLGTAAQIGEAHATGHSGGIKALAIVLKSQDEAVGCLL
jgi:hypothetical protein